MDIFTRNDYRKVVADSILHCINNKGLIVHGWVLMTNHVHLLVSLQQGNSNTLSDVMRDMKKYTAMQLIKSIKENPMESRQEWMMVIFEKAGRYNSNNTNYQFCSSQLQASACEINAATSRTRKKCGYLTYQLQHLGLLFVEFNNVWRQWAYMI